MPKSRVVAQADDEGVLVRWREKSSPVCCFFIEVEIVELRLGTWGRRFRRVFQDGHAGATSDGTDAHGLRVKQNGLAYSGAAVTVLVSACVKDSPESVKPQSKT